MQCARIHTYTWGLHLHIHIHGDTDLPDSDTDSDSTPDLKVSKVVRDTDYDKESMTMSVSEVNNCSNASVVSTLLMWEFMFVCFILLILVDLCVGMCVCVLSLF
jgi:hypothetical protein